MQLQVLHKYLVVSSFQGPSKLTMPHTNSPLITMKRLLIAGLSNAYAVKLNDEVVAHAWREQRGI